MPAFLLLCWKEKEPKTGNPLRLPIKYIPTKKPRLPWESAVRTFRRSHSYCLPWQALYFLPLPQGQGSLRPILGSTVTGWRLACAGC